MKTYGFLLSLWVLGAVAVPVEKRQSSSMMSSFLKLLPAAYQMAPAMTIDAKPQLRSNAIRKQIRYGPFKLPANKDGPPMPKEGGHSHSGGMAPGGMAPAASPAKPLSTWETMVYAIQTLLAVKPMDPGGFSQFRVLSEAPCKNCTVLAGKMDVIFANGTRAGLSKGVYLHHAITIDLSKKQPDGFMGMCGTNKSLGGMTGGIFVGGAVDEFTQYYTTPDGKFESGYYINDNNFAMQAEMINYSKDEQSVYIQTDLEYVPGLVGVDATQAAASATKCETGLTPWKPEKDTAGTVSSDEMNVFQSGHIIAARGHMHDGGTGVTLMINNKVACTSKAVYGAGGEKTVVNGQTWETIAKMTECLDPIPVKAGDVIKVEGGYDTKNHPLRESHGVEQEAMAIMTFVFVPEKKN